MLLLSPQEDMESIVIVGKYTVNFVKGRSLEIRYDLVPDSPCGKTARFKRLVVSDRAIGQSSSIIVKFRNVLE